MCFQREISVFKFLWSGADGKSFDAFSERISVFKFLWSGADGNHLMRFQRESPFSNSSGVVRTGLASFRKPSRRRFIEFIH